MNKKISFKRPDKPVPREADDWVAASKEASEQATAPSPAKAASAPKPEPKSRSGPGTAAKARPSKSNAKQTRDRKPRSSPARSVSMSDARWVDHMLASVDRQSDMVLRRAAALSLDSAADESAAVLLASMDARAQAVIDRMKTLQSKVRPAAASSPSKP